MNKQDNKRVGDLNKAPIPLELWNKKLVFVAKQTKEAMDENRPFVRCWCQRKLWMHQAFRCLYCGEWFCQTCAEDHFGKTRAEHRAEHPIEKAIKEA